MTADFFAKARARKTVLKRTRRRDDLPEAVLYLEWLGSEGKRRVLDTKREEHVLTDTVLQSNYKFLGKSEAQKLIDAHWKEDVAKAQAPTRKTPDSATDAQDN